MPREAPQPWRTVWITGASSGIGEQLARQLGAKADYVAMAARSVDQLAAIAKDSPVLAAHPLDVTDAAAVTDLVGDLTERRGAIDLAILNAASWALADAKAIEIDAVRRGIEVNYMGVINCLAAVLPGMLARRSGHIAIMASTAGYRGLPRSLAYGPTKAALINLAETLRIELAPAGITVSLICPGFVDTPATRRNPFPMPGMISAEQAARHIVAGLERRRFNIAFPRLFATAMKTLRVLPDPVFFWIVGTFIWRDSLATNS